MQALLGALAGATLARAMSFGSAPVHGLAFAGKTGFGALIVNLSDRPFLLSVPPLLRGLPYIERSARPITLVAGIASLRNQTGTTTGTFELLPFSLLEMRTA